MSGLSCNTIYCFTFILQQFYEKISSPNLPDNAVRKSDSITRIYACATMWHENSEEMMEFLKSIMRMDEDQSARKITMKYLKVVDNDYYDFESECFLLNTTVSKELMIVCCSTVIYFNTRSLPMVSNGALRKIFADPYIHLYPGFSPKSVFKEGERWKLL